MRTRKPPKAYLLKDRPGLFRAYGVDQLTQARKPFFGKTREEAEKAARESFSQPLPKGTFADFYFKSYLPSIVMRSDNWQNQVGWAMDKYVLPQFGHMSLAELRRPVLQPFFNRLQRKMKVSSVGKIKIVLSGVLNLALADELISSNPCRFVKLPQAEDPIKTALTYEQLGRLFTCAKPEVKVFVLLSGCSAGLRIGEACGVTRMHLLGDDTLCVRQQVLQQEGGAIIAKKLKTRQTERDIPLPSGLADLIRHWSQGRLYLMGTAKGKFQLPNNVTEDLARACQAAKVPTVTPHELRHTFISLMENELEAPAAIVAALAGKKDSRVTASYSHTHETQLRSWLQKHFERFEKAVEQVGVFQKSGTHEAES